MSLSDSLAKGIYQSVAESNEERVFKHWHASSISECPRAHYFMRKGVPSQAYVSGAKVIRWGAGHQLEEELRQHIDKVWGGTTSNVRLTSKKLDLTGEYDNLTKTGDTLVEVKSVSDWAFLKGDQTTLKEATGGKNKWGRPEYGPKKDPYIHHQLQNHAYVLLLAEEGIEVKNIDYVYCSLSGLICVYKTQVNPKYLEWVKQRLELLNKALEANEPPACQCQDKTALYGTTYQWCNYRTTPSPSDTPDPNCCSLELLEEKDA